MNEPRQLIAAWRAFSSRGIGRVLEGDECLLEPYGRKRRRLILQCSTFEEYIEDEDYATRDSTRLHLGLTPIPYMGALGEACIFILMLNPGFNELDYFAETHSESFKTALNNSLRQEIAPDDFPMLSLTPRFAWHGGHDYWVGKLKDHLLDACKQRGLTWTESLRLLSRKIAVSEFCPYHSRSFGLPQTVQDKLASGKLAYKFVHDVLLPRAHAGNAAIIVTRKNGIWKLNDDEKSNIVVYSSAETRAAHLSRGSRGGKIIAKFLKA